jgi:hypothetical protein
MAASRRDIPAIRGDGRAAFVTRGGRPLGLLLRQARPGTLAPLIARRRYLMRPVLDLVLPPRAARLDPAERLGVDFLRMQTAAEIAAALHRVVAALGRGEITPAEAACLARRSRQPLRAVRRRLWQATARLKPRRPPGEAARAARLWLEHRQNSPLR